MADTFHFSGEGKGEPISLLDFLIEWVARHFIGLFEEARVSYAGQMSKVAIGAIMNNSRDEIETGNFSLCTFNTAAMRSQAGAPSGAGRTLTGAIKRKRNQNNAYGSKSVRGETDKIQFESRRTIIMRRINISEVRNITENPHQHK